MSDEVPESLTQKSREERDALVMDNRGFVYDIARNYATSGVPFNDLVNAGMVGLLVAAGRFQADKHVKFISFATCWVQHEMIKVIRETRFPCRVPLNINKVVNRARRGEIPDDDPILAEVLPLLKTPEAVRFDDVLVLEDEVVLRLSIEQALEKLDIRTRQMIQMFFGIKSMAFDIHEIAERFKLSRQRTRNLIKEGLAKARTFLSDYN